MSPQDNEDTPMERPASAERPVDGDPPGGPAVEELREAAGVVEVSSADAPADSAEPEEPDLASGAGTPEATPEATSNPAAEPTDNAEPADLAARSADPAAAADSAADPAAPEPADSAADPGEPAADAEPTGAAEPAAESAGAVEPAAESAGAAEPAAEPGEAIELAESRDVAEPAAGDAAQPGDAIEPAESGDAADPGDPTDETEPGDPVAGPADPVADPTADLLESAPADTDSTPAVGGGPSEPAGDEAGDTEDAELPALSDDELECALEALLLVVDSPADEEALAAALGTTPLWVAEHLRLMADRYTDQDRGIDLRRAGGGWRFYTRDRYAPHVEKLLLDGQRAKLTRAALETLAVIAYRQPVTRARVAAVRGVNCDGVIRTLLARGLVEETGTDLETGGFLYRTTELFLERLGLSSLEDLPPIAPLLPEVDSIDDV